VIRQILPWLLSANTITVMWLAGSKRPVAWVLGLVGQAGWVAFAVLYAAWGLLPLAVALMFVYGRNLRRWTRTSHPEDRCQRCGGRNVKSWFVASHEWNRVMDPGEITCPQCFTEAWAKATGLLVTWELRIDPNTLVTGPHPEVDQ